MPLVRPRRVALSMLVAAPLVLGQATLRAQEQPPAPSPPPPGYPPPQGYPPPGYPPPQTYPPPGYPPQGYPPQGYPPPGYPPPQGYPPQGYPPGGSPQQQPPPEAPKKREKKTVELGVGLLGFVHAHRLDKPSDRSVTVGSAKGTDETYPGFLGAHAGLGLMLDVRLWQIVGVEIDLLRQEDRGSGSIEVSGTSSCVIINNGPGAGSADARTYHLTLGQMAWHLPLLAKLSIESDDEEDARGRDGDRRAPRRSVSLLFGPELVVPDEAGLDVSPSGLPGPVRAHASSYLMLTGGLGFERQIVRAIDLRLLGSLRGSYNPSAGSGAMSRADYELVGGAIQPVSYRSEWRYQLWASLGLGVFF